MRHDPDGPLFEAPAAEEVQHTNGGDTPEEDQQTNEGDTAEDSQDQWTLVEALKEAVTNYEDELFSP